MGLTAGGVPSEDDRAADFAAILRADALAWDALRRARDAALPDWWIVSGALYQAAWNAALGHPSGYGVKDVDLFYFDDHDLSYAAEDRAIGRLSLLFGGLAAPIEIRNQARVHLWYPTRFGQPYPKLRRSTDALMRFASRTHAVAARLEPSDAITVVAPFGLADVFALRVTPNAVFPNRETYETKAARIAALWPSVAIEPWPDAPAADRATPRRPGPPSRS